jgi:hypothetical protein
MDGWCWTPGWCRLWLESVAKKRGETKKRNRQKVPRTPPRPTGNLGSRFVGLPDHGRSGRTASSVQFDETLLHHILVVRLMWTLGLDWGLKIPGTATLQKWFTTTYITEETAKSEKVDVYVSKKEREDVVLPETDVCFFFVNVKTDMICICRADCSPTSLTSGIPSASPNHFASSQTQQSPSVTLRVIFQVKNRRLVPSAKPISTGPMERYEHSSQSFRPQYLIIIIPNIS